jgi:hypothetical protein
MPKLIPCVYFLFSFLVFLGGMTSWRNKKSASLYFPPLGTLGCWNLSVQFPRIPPLVSLSFRFLLYHFGGGTPTCLDILSLCITRDKKKEVPEVAANHTQKK